MINVRYQLREVRKAAARNEQHQAGRTKGKSKGGNEDSTRKKRNGRTSKKKKKKEKEKQKQKKKKKMMEKETLEEDINNSPGLVPRAC